MGNDKADYCSQSLWWASSFTTSSRTARRTSLARVDMSQSHDLDSEERYSS